MVSIRPQVLLKNGLLTNCLLFGKTNVCCYNKFVRTKCFYCMETLGLQLSTFTVWKPRDYKYFLLHINPKVVNFVTTLTSP